MIKSYRFVETKHNKLHSNIMNFFNRIEFEEGEYSINFYDKGFYKNIVSHHPIILEAPLKSIFEEIKVWEQDKRSEFIDIIRKSNNIERICRREIIPVRIKDIDENLRDTISDLFTKLYIQVLNGDSTKKTYGSLQDHFMELKTPNKVFKCPTCGLMASKSKEEKRDDYDHYLPKHLFPFSSVNFQNLIPICTDCNGTDVKGKNDILSINDNRRIFYPYDNTHTGIKVTCSVTNDNIGVKESDLNYSFNFTTMEGNREEEIESWKTIFKIDDRYQKRAKGKGDNWYRHFWEFMNDPTFKDFPEEDKRDIYFNNELRSVDLEFIKLPVIEAIENTSFVKASIEVEQYSMF